MMAARQRPYAPTLSELLQGLCDSVPGGDLQVTHLTLDSREVRVGSVFCALSGTRAHGLDFASQAASQGAAAVLAEPAGDWDSRRIRALQRRLRLPVVAVEGLGRQLSPIAGRLFADPSVDLDVIAATGTNGKTSICQFVAQALDGELPCGVVGTLGYGFPGQLSATAHTTPDAIRLQGILAELRDRGAAAVAMEISSHALAQERASGVRVRTAVFTNLTRDHLDYHADMADYAQAKRRLFHTPGLAHAVLNADDSFGRELLGALDPAVLPVLYGLPGEGVPGGGKHRWLQARSLEPQSRGMRVRVAGSWGEGAFVTGLLGRFNVANLLAVLAILLLRGWDLPRALSRLEQVTGVPGRMERFGGPGQPMVVVDYAHTPDALAQVLAVLREHQPRRLITLFGCGGERDRGKRPAMGEVAERLSDLVILTDDNPRGEAGAGIVREILAGMQAPDRVRVERNRGRAIRYGVCVAAPGDILLVAGKGHEMVQKVGDLELPFSDRAQVTQALNERGGCAR